MADESDKPPGDTQQFERPDFDELDDVDGTQELDSTSIEEIEDSAIEPVSPPEEGLARGSSNAESTQVIERDRLQRAAEQDGRKVRGPDQRNTEKMTAVDDSTSVYDSSPDEVEDKTSAYQIPPELLQQASGESNTQKMSAVTDETAEFDGSVDQWVEVDDSGVVRCMAEVDEQGRLVLPRRLLEDGTVRPGTRVVIEAQIIRTDD